MQGMIVYALKRFIFLTGLIILMQNEVDKPTRLLRFAALLKRGSRVKGKGRG